MSGHGKIKQARGTYILSGIEEGVVRTWKESEI
jgi:hypothetical protein